jgi:hypothetical protein
MRPTLTALLLAALVAAQAAGAYPKPPKQNLERPFTGKPVARRWLGSWLVVGGESDGVTFRFFPRKSAACRTITAGRMSCFVSRPPGSTELWMGSVSLAGGKVVFRMTYRPRPDSFGCFEDDPYSYRLTAKRLSLVKGGPSSCFWEPTERFPILLKRVQ